jgi:uncharacterized repeat protein (TIGR01451 family)
MYGSAKGKAIALLKMLAILSLVVVVLLVWAMTASTSLAQDPRPTLTPVPPPSPTQPPGAPAQPAASSGYSSPILRGRVVNVKTGQPESGVTVVFVAGGVSVDVLSDENGEYIFEHLGSANGVINIVPPQGSGLKPVTKDVAVRTKLGVETVVNLGVSPNGSGAPPLMPTVRLDPAFISTGENMTITVLVKNTLPESISDAVVTNWLPAGVVPVAIRSSTGNPYFSDNLAVAELGTLQAGDGALVEIVAQAAGGGSSTSSLQGKASLFYRERAAGQAQALGHSNGAAPTVLPVTGAGLPVVGLVLIIVVVSVGWLRRRVGGTLAAN